MPNRTALYNKGIGVPLSQSLTLLLFLSIGSALLVSAQTVRKGELSARQIAQRTFPSVVVLVAEDRSGDKYLGSGFFVDHDVVATNYHVIKGATKIAARSVGQKRVYQVSILSTDEESDLALLKLDGAIARPLPLARGNRIAVGDVVYVAGNPEGLEGTFSQGIVSALRGSEYVQITAPISHGSSGGPLLNSRGEVIGVAAGAIEEGQNLNFAIPISRLSVLIARSKRDIDPLDEAVAKVKRKKAAPAIRSAPATSPDDSLLDGLIRDKEEAGTYVDEGWRLFFHERFAEAVEAFKKALRLTPDDTNALLGLGDAYSFLHKYEEGIETYKVVLQSHAKEEDEVRAQLGLARAYGWLDKYQEAIDIYKDVIRMHPQETDAYFSLARLLDDHLHRYDEAIEVYRRGIKADPKYFLFYSFLATLLESQDRMQEAEAVLRTAIQQSDMPTLAYVALGDHYCDRLKRCSEAIGFYKSAIAALPKDPQSHYQLGKAYLKAGDRSSAIKEYRLLKSLNSTWAEWLFNEIYK
jgi:S1-C subfamily serine protease/Tfp pilus assembly protein PilF